MTKDELTTWFTELFYEQYRDLTKTPFVTKYGIGSKGEALKKLLQMKPSDELRQRILFAIAEQKKHRRKLFEQCGSMQKYLEITKFNKFYSTRMCSTWINQMGWEDEIPELHEIEKQSQGLFEGRCKSNGCAQPVHGVAFEYCAECLSRNNEDKDLLRDQLRKMKLTLNEGESQHDYAMRCKAVALKKLKGFNYGL
jgi:hypothetical protein